VHSISRNLITPRLLYLYLTCPCRIRLYVLRVMPAQDQLAARSLQSESESAHPDCLIAKIPPSSRSKSPTYFQSLSFTLLHCRTLISQCAVVGVRGLREPGRDITASTRGRVFANEQMVNKAAQCQSFYYIGTRFLRDFQWLIFPVVIHSVFRACSRNLVPNTQNLCIKA